jgi:hypothetical protein
LYTKKRQIEREKQKSWNLTKSGSVDKSKSGQLANKKIGTIDQN